MSDLMIRELVQTATTTDANKAAHIVSIPEHLKGTTTPQAYVMTARVEGIPVTALCGHTWIPQADPLPLPVCEPCLEAYRHDPLGHGDRGELPDA